MLVVGLLPLSVATAGAETTPVPCSLKPAAAVTPVTVEVPAPGDAGAATTTTVAGVRPSAASEDEPTSTTAQPGVTTTPSSTTPPDEAGSIPGAGPTPAGGEPGAGTTVGSTTPPDGEADGLTEHDDTLGDVDAHDDVFVPLVQRPVIPFLPDVGRHPDQVAAAADARSVRTSLVSLLAAAQDERQVKWQARAVAVQRVADAGARLRALGVERAERVGELVASRDRLEQAARDGFVHGTGESVASWLAADGHPGVARSLVRSVQDQEQSAVEAWSAAVAEADELVRKAVCEQIAAGDELASAELAVGAAEQLVRLHQEALAVAETRVAVLEASAGPGMSFPVAGDVWFGSTWHAPRPEGRLHLGVDIIAPWGAPVLAVESGVLYRAEWNRLGGWKLWLAGDSGATYYYGHFAAYAPSAFTGQRVRAGELIAWVGDTGAKGRPHLHLEVHPFGGDAVDPYPFVSALFANAPAPQMWVSLPSSLRDRLPEGFDAEPPVIMPTTRQ